MENQHQKITGYRDLTQAEIDLMNEIKRKGEDLGKLVETMREAKDPKTGLPSLDGRWISIGATDLQTGLMALTRAVAQPTTF